MRSGRSPDAPLPDVITQLGPMAFASRLKRLQERLLRDVGRLYDDLGTAFQPRWFLLIYTLHARGPASVTELAAALSQSHAAVNQVAGELLKAGYLTERRARDDERKRVLSLSARGRTLASRMLPVWEEIGAATADLIGETGVDLLGALSALEAALDRSGIHARVRQARGESVGPAVEILDYRPAFKKHFRELNYDWLREYFTVEPADEKLLSDPRGRIINRGGAVLFAACHGDIVGTCALLKHGPREFELAKMAVARPFRRQGIGRALVGAAQAKARRLGGARLLVLTSRELSDAIRLYKKLGFRPCPMPAGLSERYHRATQAMDLGLRTPAKRRTRS